MKQTRAPGGEFRREGMAPWRRDNLDHGILKAIASQKPLPAGRIREHYAACNRIFAQRVAEHEKANGRLPDPEPGEYIFAAKKCTDSRHATGSLGLFFTAPAIHENTAGSIVRGGHLFKALHPDGFGAVEGHFECGATKVAHLYHADRFHGAPDEDVVRILTSIPAAVAAPEDAAVRDRWNALHQAAMGNFTLMLEGRQQKVYPTFLSWECGIDYQWLDGMPMKPPFPLSTIENEVRALFDCAFAEGRELATQYSTMSVMYDPYRLGRFNDPRIIMDALANEFFCITFDFGRVANGGKKQLSRTGMGSLRYANFHDNVGHVRGVGGEDGTRIVGVLDPDERVLEKVKGELLSDPQIKEMTRNGEAILPIKYDLETRLAEFL